MIHTEKFRIYPKTLQERKLHEIFTIYNRVKRIGYNLLFRGEDYTWTRWRTHSPITLRLVFLLERLKIIIKYGIVFIIPKFY